MAIKSPLAIMKDKFGDKEKLVAAVKTFTTDALWLPRVASDRGRDKGLEHVSNAKLLRLHAVFTEVKEKFGSRIKLVDAILEAERRIKDTGLRKRLEAYPVPRLMDIWRSTQKRAKVAAKKPVAAVAKPAKKPVAKTAKA